MTLEDLLEPVSDAAPAGVDLSYDPERYRIEQAFDSAAQGESDVDWRDTIERIEAQSRRTKDVWLAVALARAGARAGQLETIEAGCAMLAGLFEQYWDSVHPLIEEYGLQGRKGPCESLTRIGEFLGPLRRIVLIAHARFGSYTGEDIERFASEGDAADGYGMFRAALADTPVAALQDELERLGRVRDALGRADGLLTERAAQTSDTGTNFQPAYAAIDAIIAALSPFAGVAPEPESEADATVSGDETAGAPAARAARPGRIETRDDVARALDAIVEYYQRREPSSPIPAALRRVKGWIAMDFMAILQDIAPNGVSDANTVLSPRAAEEASSTW
jgi:type VI secretion system ImpA family protein